MEGYAVQRHSQKLFKKKQCEGSALPHITGKKSMGPSSMVVTLYWVEAQFYTLQRLFYEYALQKYAAYLSKRTTRIVQYR